MNHRPGSIAIISLLAFTVNACATVKPHPPQETIDAALWMQTSAEYHAITTQTYRAATEKLAMALADPNWTAAREQTGDYSGLPPAVILDVDETVLDNSPYAARLIISGTAYSPDTWNRWCHEAKAKPVPGALEFTRFAARNGVTVFYVTNRNHELEESTRRNLEKDGFPLDPETDTVLTKAERPEWSSSKVERRKHVAQNYRILFLFGDDFNDFTPARGIAPEKRVAIAREAVPMWGVKWFQLPNPTYGSWETVLHDAEPDPDDPLASKYRHLDPAE